MPAFSTEVAVRWSDMDVFGHVNNARTITLIEEARTELLFAGGVQRTANDLSRGVVVARLTVHYRRPLVYSGTPVPLRVWVTDVRAASFDLDYEVKDGQTGEVAATARTQLVSYDLDAGRPRRLTADELAFLNAYRDA